MSKDECTIDRNMNFMHMSVNVSQLHWAGLGLSIVNIIREFGRPGHVTK